MKYLGIFLLSLFAISTCLGQKSHPFDIKEVIDSTLKKKTPEDFSASNSNFFEDEHYVASKTCSGEWGGTIKFRNKKTGIEYACRATCPVVVNKISGKYVVTNSLGHLNGFTQVIEIAVPDSLDIFKIPPPRKKGRKLIYYVGDNESKSKKGLSVLADSIGILALTSFTYQGELFHVITDFHKTFLAKLKDHKFVTLDTISDQRIWGYDTRIVKIAEDHSVVFFDNERTKGYLEILDNKITLIRYK
jgi:hypothetical protein